MNTCSVLLTELFRVSTILIHATVVYLCPSLYIIPLHEYTMMYLPTVSLENISVAYRSELFLRKKFLSCLDMRHDRCKSSSTVYS